MCSLLSANQNHEEFRKAIGKQIPFIITDVAIGNKKEDEEDSLVINFDDSIFRQEADYLVPKIKYKKTTTEFIRPTIKVRLYTPLSYIYDKTEASPSDCSYEEKMILEYPEQGEYTFDGYKPGYLGKKGKWPKGNYRFEFWYEDVCLKSKTFEIY